MSFTRLYLWKQYICQFNPNYSIEKTYNAPFWYKFNSTAFKKHPCPTTELRKNYRFSRHYILGTYKPNLIELILKPVLIYLHFFSYWCYSEKQIRKVNATQYNSTNAHSFKVVMYIQKLHLSNTSSSDDGPKLGRMYMVNN